MKMTAAQQESLALARSRLSQYSDDDCNLVVRLPPTLRRRIKLAAIQQDVTLRDWVELAIWERLTALRAGAV